MNLNLSGELLLWRQRHSAGFMQVSLTYQFIPMFSWSFPVLGRTKRLFVLSFSLDLCLYFQVKLGKMHRCSEAEADLHYLVIYMAKWCRLVPYGLTSIIKLIMLMVY